MSAEAEPRRSVRSTKGQHKALDQLEQPIEPKRRGRKKKSEEKQEEEPENEIIRCVCGATEQEGDSAEPWIACDKCAAWQHNVCMGKSIYDEDLASEYFCEECKPEDHKELLEGIARGEKPWEARRKAYEEESKKKRKGGRKGGRGKRISDTPKDDGALQTPASVKGGKPSPAPTSAQATTPTPEVKKEAPTTKAAGAGSAGTKRKARDQAEDKEHKKMRKISETQAVPVDPSTAAADDAASPSASASASGSAPASASAPASTPATATATASAPAPVAVAEPPLKLVQYDPPADLPAAISELLEARQGPAKALKKNITVALGALEKKGKLSAAAADGVPMAQKAERFALQIERAVQDTHANPKEYGAQVKTLAFNLKNNPDLVKGLLERTLSPPMLAVMTTDQLASKELQRETAKMIERAEKQSILITEEGPRVKITHKGEEIIESDEPSAVDDSQPVPRRLAARNPGPEPAEDDLQAVPEQTGGDAMEVELPADLEYRRPPAKEGLRIDPQHPAKASGFDIKKVFSKVKSPTQPLRRLSHPAGRPAKGPVDDAEVDRLIADDGPESPPYSPTEETPTDPEVIWRGVLDMPGTATLQVTSKFMGGGNLKVAFNLAWEKLFPSRITIGGRIGVDEASTYLCGIRWRSMFDLVVTGLAPASDAMKPQFAKIVEYFSSKGKYGVILDKALPNVRDTYLIPLLPGGEMPEIMLNLQDNHVPENRTEPMILIVFVYQNDPEQLKQLRESNALALQQQQQQQQPQPQNSPTVAQSAGMARHPSISAPTFSPNTPQSALPPTFPPHSSSQGQAGYAQSPGAPAPVPNFQGGAAVNGTAPNNQVGAGPVDVGAVREKAQQDGLAFARQILGEGLIGSPTVQFLLPNAGIMHPREWNAIKKILEEHPRARDDLPTLTHLITEYTKNRGQERARERQQQQQQQQQLQQQQLQQQRLAQQPSVRQPPPPVPPQGQQAPPAQQHVPPPIRQQPPPQPQQQQTPVMPPTYPVPSPHLASPHAGQVPVPKAQTPSAGQPSGTAPRTAPMSQTPIPIPRIPHTPQPKAAAAASRQVQPAQPSAAPQATPVPVPAVPSVAAPPAGGH